VSKYLRERSTQQALLKKTATKLLHSLEFKPQNVHSYIGVVRWLFMWNYNNPLYEVWVVKHSCH
jgi:hypothetical protein